MSDEEYEKLSEERPDLLRIIDGSVYYSFDYTDYLYNELQKRDNIINRAIEYIEKQEDYFNEYPLINRQELLDILKGDDKE